MTTLTTVEALRAELLRSASPQRGRAPRADRLAGALRQLIAEEVAEEAGQAQPRVYGYGLALIEPTRVFREITSDGRIHLVDVISGDEIDGVFAHILNNRFIWPGTFPGNIDADGTIGAGRYSGTGKKGNKPPIGSKIFEKRGGAGQTAVPELVAETSADSTFVGTGLAYVYSRITFIDGLFPGDPEFKFICRMRRAVDPRDQSVRWSFNPYVHLYDILTKSVDIGGAGVDPSRLDTASFIAGCNWADMLLDAQPVTAVSLLTIAVEAAGHVFEFSDPVTPFAYGDVVRVVAASGQTMPANLSPGVDYHVIPIRHAVSDFQVPGIALAATLIDALEGNYLDPGERLSPINIKKVKEVRYVSGFIYASNEDALSVIRRMLESCGAAIYLDDGKIALTRQNFPATIETVIEDEVRPDGSVALSNALPSSERATELTGTYTALTNLLEPDDYPTVDGGGVHETQDQRRIPRRLELPFVAKAGVAQRLATIALRRIRQERTIAFSGTLSLYRLKPGTIFSLDRPSLGLDAATTFEVRSQTLIFDTNEGRPRLRIDVIGRQLESDTFDLAASDEQLVASAKIPGIDTPFDPDPPGTPQITESLFVTTNGAGVKARATVTWTAPPGRFIRGYKVSYKLASASTFVRLAETPDLSLRIDDIAPGLYDFEVVAIATNGTASEPAERQIEVLALSAPPSDPTGFFGQQQNLSVILEWDLSPDLDVLFGGNALISHQSDIAGGKGGSSRLLAKIDGNLTAFQVPFVRGTYYLAFADQQGNVSGFAEWSTDEVRPVPFGQTIAAGLFVANDGVTENQVTIAESPSFPSTNGGNTMVHDSGNGWITLPLEGGIDSIADIDAVPDIDAIPAGDSVAPEGFWFFDNDIELNASFARTRWEAEIETEVADIASGIDSVPNIDLVPNIDAIGAGTAQPGQASAWIEVRFSRGTIASDTFGDWERLESRTLFHRSFQFRVRAQSFLPTVNIRVTIARLLAREVPFDQ